MIEVNNNKYRLCLLDTNIISEMLKNPKGEFKNFIDIEFSGIPSIPCFSAFTIIEIKRMPKLYDSFLTHFSSFPSLILKGYEQILQEEVNKYPATSSIDPSLIFPIGIRLPDNMNRKDSLKMLFDTQQFLDKENMWNNEKKTILDGMLSLVNNYPPKGDKYTTERIKYFVKMASIQQVAMRAPDFVKNIKYDELKIKLFPSVLITSYVVFYKFYSDNRRPIESDVFDIIISASLPYVDVFYTEKHLAEIINKTKKLDGFIDHLEVKTINNLRN